MPRLLTILLLLVVQFAFQSGFALLQAAEDPLPSWNDGAAKQRIMAFVAKVTNEGGSEYVPLAQRVVVFDNDGTLWCEQPMYVQMEFALDRVRALASQHPEWRTTQPFQGVLEDNLAVLAVSGEKGAMEIINATHSGMTTDEFNQIAADWLATAKHQRFNRLYTECVYQPMLELLKYLRENEFQTYIVSGGGVDFVRVFAEKVYGIPPHQVIGSTIKTQYEVRNGNPVLLRLPEMDFVTDKAGKPVAIQRRIGARPLMAFGNSDGDYEMLDYTTSGSGPRFGLIVHHTDSERESAYDRYSLFGRLDQALTDANKKGWTLVDMRRDWKVIFPPSR